MPESELVIHFGEPIQPIERDPIPVNKKVFGETKKEFGVDAFSWFETLGLVASFMEGMPPMTGETAQATKTKNGYVEIFVMKEVRRLAVGREVTIS